MWLLENESPFQGRRLWLRPGKTYLFGRTEAEPGQLVISHHTISRKHLTITVGEVAEGQAHHLSSRSKLTITDFGSKIGTVINGQKIKNQSHVVETEETEMIMGKCPDKFHITWLPIVFAFSFTKKELQTQPLASLRERFEHLDIKLVTDYAASTTHVVSKKRNTAKGLQALINGKFIVDETFLDAVSQAAEPVDNGELTGSSPLEEDFGRHWPNATDHLPPRGGEPVQHPDSIYTPDPERSNIFEGYTFIFYDQAQFDNLLAPISAGGGKALLGSVIPEVTEVDEFVQYVKNVAGEKGLGAFDDGSEGKGVVLVRYLPPKGHLVEWYARFFTGVSLRLDHRPIEQSEFLEAILTKDASILRRPLEVESTPNTQADQVSGVAPLPELTPQIRTEASQSEPPERVPAEESQPAPKRAKTRRPIKRRFVGFDDEADIDMDEIPPAPAAASNPAPEEEDGLFVSQEQDPPPAYEGASTTRSSRRKRAASPLQEEDLMEGIAPTAARYKRQRLEMGEDLETPSQEVETPAQASQAEPEKEIKKEMDILAVAARHREAEEARALAEKEDLARLPDDVDLSEIRRLNIVEEMEVHVPPAHPRTREDDVADGRWNPKWNGMKNFKKFKRRGEPRGREPTRVIVSLTEVKPKQMGLGDNYWLEDEDSPKQQSATRPAAQPPQPPESAPPSSRSSEQRRAGRAVMSDSSDEEEDDMPVQSQSAPSRTRASRAATAQSQTSARTRPSRSTTGSQSNKRPAPEPTTEKPAKRQRPRRNVIQVAESDDSDDELKFQFGKRR